MLIIWINFFYSMLINSNDTDWLYAIKPIFITTYVNTFCMNLFVCQLGHSTNWPFLSITHYVNSPLMRIGMYVYETLRISICMRIGLYEFTGHLPFNTSVFKKNGLYFLVVYRFVYFFSPFFCNFSVHKFPLCFFGFSSFQCNECVWQ